MAEQHSAPVLARFREPRFALAPGEDAGVSRGRAGARAAGALVEIHVFRGEDARLTLRFRAYGDPATIAAADWVCESLDGQAIGTPPPAAPEVVRALELPGRRAHSADLATQALAHALAQSTEVR